MLLLLPVVVVARLCSLFGASSEKIYLVLRRTRWILALMFWAFFFFPPFVACCPFLFGYLHLLQNSWSLFVPYWLVDVALNLFEYSSVFSFIGTILTIPCWICCWTSLGNLFIFFFGSDFWLWSFGWSGDKILVTCYITSVIRSCRCFLPTVVLLWLPSISVAPFALLTLLLRVFFILSLHC